MIIWINGTYGVGKTAVANKIKELLKYTDVTIIDTDEICEQHNEEIFLRLILFGNGPEPQTNTTTINLLKQTLQPYLYSDSICIVPMTITKTEGVLLLNDICNNANSFHHVILVATEETIRKRILNDQTRLDKGLALSELSANIAFLEKHFLDIKRIDTTDMCNDDIAQQIIDIVIHKK